MKIKLGPVSLLIMALLLSVGVGPSLARGTPPTPTLPTLTAFTYQGRLTEGGLPVSGIYDFEFKLFDALTNGNPVGSTVSKNDVTVTQGLFTLVLDFGVGVFTTTARYLEISVRAGNSTGAYTLLTPRQALTPTPQALFAQGAPWAGLSEVPAGFADNVDNDTLYTAGTGLTLVSQQFAVDTTLIQSRINNACPAGSSIRQISATGEVVCETDDVGATGILTLNPGPGLSGGGSGAVVTLTVMFAGSGSATTVARSDHTHNALTAADGLPANAVYVDNDGRVGIGTNNPGMPLDVVGNIRSNGQFISTLSTGTAPLTVSSSTLVTNLNADLLDGIHASSFVTSAHTHWGQTWAGSGVGLTLKDGAVGVAGIGSTSGLSGTATGLTGLTYGVYGQGGTTSATNFGVYGQAEDYGVYGLAQTAAGTWGSTLATDAGVGGAQGIAPNTHGVLGLTNAAARAGAKGIGGLEVPLPPVPAVGLWGTSVGGHGAYLTNNTGAYSTLWLANTSGAGLLIEAYGADPGDREFYVSSNGTVGADGFYYGAGYLTGSADFAEMLPGHKGLEPGDVLVIGPEGELTRCTAPNQTNVVGVYSTQPGFVGGASENTDLTGKVPLAVVGVVPVKVTAANGPIKPGDLLTTSALPGHAMRATPITLSGYTFYPSGIIIGKALAAWSEGTGVILMLVMVQ